MSKTTVSKTAKAKDKSKLNIIGFFYGSYFKLGYVKIFKYIGNVEDFLENLKVEYGDSVVGRYVIAPDLDMNFDNLAHRLSKYTFANQVYKCLITEASEILKSTVNAKTASHFGDKKKNISKKNASNESPTNDSDKELSESEKPVVKKVGTHNSKSSPKKGDSPKKEDISDEETSEDEVPKQKKMGRNEGIAPSKNKDDDIKPKKTAPLEKTAIKTIKSLPEEDKNMKGKKDTPAPKPVKKTISPPKTMINIHEDYSDEEAIVYVSESDAVSDN